MRDAAEIERELKIAAAEMARLRAMASSVREVYPGQFAAQRRMVEANAEQIRRMEEGANG